MFKFFEKSMLNFTDWVLNTPIFELALQRNVAIDKIESLSIPVNEHLFKLYVMQKSTYREHWMDEIDNFMIQINDISWGKKRNKFKFNEYYEWMFTYYFYDRNNIFKNNLKRYLKKILDKYPNEDKIDWNIIEFKNIVESFYIYFSFKLENGSYYYEDLYEYLEEKFVI